MAAMTRLFERGAPVAREDPPYTWRSTRFSGMVLLAFNTMDKWRLGLLDYLDGSPTKLLPVLDIASSSSFCQCFKLMSCCVMPTSSEYSPFCRSCWNLVVLPSSSESSCQCSIQDPSFRVLELY
ncbi:hypothetical protein D1007_37307 [Hordeum vulgare]|nr:hypothetical protein D1007_37307 [Hordeum vulgare]